MAQVVVLGHCSSLFLGGASFLQERETCGHGSMWAVGAVGVVGAVWVCGRGCVGGCGCVQGVDGAVSACRCWGCEIVLSADPARAVYVQSPMHGVHTWPKVLVWTPETLRASQSERDTSVPCCLYRSEDSNALAYISTW